jgi:hypothetical protein
MAEETERYPTYVKVPATPSVEGAGVAVAFAPLATGRYRPGEPIALHGVCAATGAVLQLTRGRALAGVLLVVVRRDRPAGRMKPVLDVSNLPPRPEPGEMDDEERDAVQEISYFNVDLQAMFEVPDEPGKYWVMAALGEAASDRLPFEVVPPDEAPQGAPEAAQAGPATTEGES